MMNTRLLMTLRVTVATPHSIGAVPHGTRWTAPLTGGEFEGPRLRGEPRSWLSREMGAWSVWCGPTARARYQVTRSDTFSWWPGQRRIRVGWIAVSRSTRRTSSRPERTLHRRIWKLPDGHSGRLPHLLETSLPGVFAVGDAMRQHQTRGIGGGRRLDRYFVCPSRAGGAGPRRTRPHRSRRGTHFERGHEIGTL